MDFVKFFQKLPIIYGALATKVEGGRVACHMDPAACCRSHASWFKVQGVRALAHWLGGWVGVDADLKTGFYIA